MKEKYVRKKGSHYNIVRNSTNYGRFESIDDAVLIRDELVENGWNLDSIGEIHELNGEFLIVKVIDDKVCILEHSKAMPSKEKINELYLKKLRNPNNSRYGLNITKVFDTFVIKKRIAGDDYIFGYYDRLEDAEFARNHLLENSWNVNEFDQIMYDAESSTYKVVEVIDDRVYILDSFKTDKISIDEVRADFLNRIRKHEMGLARHPHLDELKGKIPELEERFNVKTRDDVWDLEKEKPLEMIFSMTPFQKSVYDAVNHSTFDEIKKSLIRYKSGNFDEKIRKNLDELADSGMIVKNGQYYDKR